MPKGVLNVEWEICAQVARDMGNDSAVNIKRLMRELKIIKPDLPGIRRVGFNGEFEGYTLEEVVEAWRWIRTREEFPINDARLTTMLLGSPCNLQKFDQYVMDNIPAVYDQDEHDRYIRKYAKVLARLGFVYRADRIGAEELEQLGLKGV